MKSETKWFGLLILISSLVGLFWYNSRQINQDHKIETALIEKLQEENSNSQKEFGSLMKKKIEIKKVDVWDCQEQEDEILTCHAYVDLVTFRGEESQEMKIKLEKNKGKWKAIQISKI